MSGIFLLSFPVHLSFSPLLSGIHFAKWTTQMYQGAMEQKQSLRSNTNLLASLSLSLSLSHFIQKVPWAITHAGNKQPVHKHFISLVTDDTWALKNSIPLTITLFECSPKTVKTLTRYYSFCPFCPLASWVEIEFLSSHKGPRGHLDISRFHLFFRQLNKWRRDRERHFVDGNNEWHLWIQINLNTTASISHWAKWKTLCSFPRAFSSSRGPDLHLSPYWEGI